ncbi:MAG: hypothetical protein VB122_08540 [Erysipelotrichales bacterium]|nr:hypothetical protein [Erysipelotrichales bacterium]
MKKTLFVLLALVLTLTACFSKNRDSNLVELTAIEVEKFDASADIQIEASSTPKQSKEVVLDGDKKNTKWVLSTDAKASVIAKAGLSISNERHTLLINASFLQVILNKPELFSITIDSSTKQISIKTKS